MTIAVVIVVIPIALGVPASFVFIPPAMVGVPAALTGCAEIVTGVLGLPALIAMAGNSLVEFWPSARNAPLATFVGAQKRHCSEHQKAGQHCRRKDRFPDE